jgi:hypothetical protein
MLFKLYTTVAAQPAGFTVTPVGDAVDALNAEAGQLPVADPIPTTYAHPLAGWTHVVDAPGRTIAAVNVNMYGFPARVTLIVSVPLGVAPVVGAKVAVTLQSWQSGFVPISFL